MASFFLLKGLRSIADVMNLYYAQIESTKGSWMVLYPRRHTIGWLLASVFAGALAFVNFGILKSGTGGETDQWTAPAMILGALMSLIFLGMALQVLRNYPLTVAGERWESKIDVVPRKVYSISPLFGLADRALVVSIRVDSGFPVKSFRMIQRRRICMRYRITVRGWFGPDHRDIIARTLEQVLYTTDTDADSRTISLDLPIESNADSYEVCLVLEDVDNEADPASRINMGSIPERAVPEIGSISLKISLGVGIRVSRTNPTTVPVLHQAQLAQ